jgi:hypothetical protein
VLLVLCLIGLSLIINRSRLGFDLSGGNLLPVGDLRQLWSTYLADWHPVDGGTSAPASPALAVLGVFGAPFALWGGPSALVSLLFLAQLPFAALSAYWATRRLSVGRWTRFLVAAVYSLVPVATASAAQGRLDVVVVHILLPVVVAGIVGVVLGINRRWLHGAVICAMGVALIGAFSPLAHLLALVALVAGFVLLPPEKVPTIGFAGRIGSMVIVVVLSLLLLVPWPLTVLTHLSLMIHGLSGAGATPAWGSLLLLAPGGIGSWFGGAAVVLAALIAVVRRPNSRVLVGFGISVLGVLGVLAVCLLPLAPLQSGPAGAGYPGVPLLVVVVGLLWMVLAALGGFDAHSLPDKENRNAANAAESRSAIGAAGLLGVFVVMGLVIGYFLIGAGSQLGRGADALDSAQVKEITDTGGSVLLLDGDFPLPKQSAGRLPLFGDEQLALPPQTPSRLARWQESLRSGTTDDLRRTFASIASDGVLFLVLPPEVQAAPFARVAPDLVVPASPTKSGRQVLRLLPPAGQVVLIPPELARQALAADAPSDFAGASVVSARLPDVRLRVSAGPAGRLLVFAAEQEPGWQASVNGGPVPVVRVWGNQIAVAVPETEAEVVVEHQSMPRNVLLLIQVAALLFALLTAIPGRARRRELT